MALREEERSFDALFAGVRQYLPPEEYVAAWDKMTSSLRRVAWKELALMALAKKHLKSEIRYRDARRARLREVTEVARDLMPVVRRVIRRAQRDALIDPPSASDPFEYCRLLGSLYKRIKQTSLAYQ